MFFLQVKTKTNEWVLLSRSCLNLWVANVMRSQMMIPMMQKLQGKCLLGNLPGNKSACLVREVQGAEVQRATLE